MFFILSYAFYLVGKLNLNLKDLRLTKGLATGGYRSAKSIISMILQSQTALSPSSYANARANQELIRAFDAHVHDKWSYLWYNVS
jgi:hypothetical protein